MSTYLDDILAHHRERARSDTRRLDVLIQQAADIPPPRGFAAALVAEPGKLSVIAEIKRRSPSAGVIRENLNPSALAGVYAEGEAAALSVLTDEPHFSGSPADLTEARSAVELPVIRKDFTVSSKDVCDARLMGADAVLLIVAALSDGELRDFLQLAGELGMDALVETHDEAELEHAAAAGARLVGVNQRNLRTFEVDHSLAARLAPELPPDAVAVAESGIRGRHDAEVSAAAGYDALLVGESLLRRRGDDLIRAAIADLRQDRP